MGGWEVCEGVETGGEEERASRTSEAELVKEPRCDSGVPKGINLPGDGRADLQPVRKVAHP